MDEYSKCDLTYHTDKLVTISGLAKRIQDLTSWPKTDYLAGIWRQGLPRRLLWYTNIYSATKPDALPSWRTGICSAKKPNLLPSWSWAHISDHTVYSPHIWSTNDGDSDIAEVLAAHTTPLQDPFGSIKDGVIVLRGKLCQVRLEREPFLDKIHKAKIFVLDKWIRLPKLPVYSVPWDARFDLERLKRELLGRTVFFMPVSERI